ncbi:MAG: single-stranded-DNA-specific exonuclease RecJ [Candidatus Babeliales bacterium]|nr:single-stranded-DNA-specific exonuclease RecJ [Candidatus Babeliales bacterium]
MHNRQTRQGQKYLWLLPEENNRAVLEFAKTFSLSPAICQTLVSRGLDTKELIDAFLFTNYETNVAHTSLMKDADKAIDRILEAIERKEKILIFGDYDVDGITSSAMMMLCLPPLGALVNFFLPNRVKDGYGLSVKAVQRAAQNGYKVIITVDNGITAFEPALEAKKLGIDLIITDHHRPHDHLPEAFAVIDPNQLDCAYPFKYLAGVGVTFKLLSLLYEKKGMQLPVKVYELLLLGTVADVVPLQGENRYWVRYGLNSVNKYESLSLRTLKTNGKFEKPKLTSTDIGFFIAPQINALGRLEDARQGVQFLIDSNEKEVSQIGTILLELNQARKGIEKSIFADIDRQIQSGAIDVSKENIILAASNNWPAGVIGLVASRFVGQYGKPTILFHLTKDGYAKGSCRSIPEFNMFDALAANVHLLEKFGGHSQAAGLSLKVENLAELKANLEHLIATTLTELDLKQKIRLDAKISLEDLNKKFLTDLEYLEPFGHQNHKPYFYIENVTLVQKPQLLKEAHVKCQIFADGVIKPVMFFNRPDLFEKFTNQNDEPFALVAQVVENHWNGRVNVELQGLDIAGLK